MTAGEPIRAEVRQLDGKLGAGQALEPVVLDKPHPLGVLDDARHRPVLRGDGDRVGWRQDQILRHLPPANHLAPGRLGEDAVDVRILPPQSHAEQEESRGRQIITPAVLPAETREHTTGERLKEKIEREGIAIYPEKGET
jgi:hypothetical protein